MRWLPLILCCASLSAQTLTFATYDNTGQNPDVALPAAYQFPATPQGGSANTLVKVTNTGSSAVEVVGVYVGETAGSGVVNPDFTVTGLDQGNILAPGSWQLFTLNFTPSAIGQLTGYLQVAYVAEQGGCALNGTPQCAGAVAAVSTITGVGIASQWLLTDSKSQGVLQPSATARLDFGDTATSATSAITFKVTNQTSSAITAPAVSIQNPVFLSSAFSLDASNLPQTIPANGSGTFTVAFAPGQTGLTTATLLVGTNSYGIEGTGVVTSDIDALQVAYVDSTGVRTLPQAATPISFGQLVPGTAGGTTLNFTVTNPATSIDTVTLSTLSVSGAAYTLTGGPTLPATIAPNASITFSVTFTATNSGTFTGTLSVGTRQFALTGLSVVSPVPTMSIEVSQAVLTSAQQPTVQIAASLAATSSNIGELTMAFTSAVSGVSDDPAIVFLATGGRSLQINLASGSQTATYNSQSALGFQTGTTAGTITFTLTFPNTPPVTKSFTITPAQTFISSAQAVRQAPNLVVTVNGYDNTYSAGKLSYTFYDTQGAQIGSAPMTVDATSDFHQYFFTNDTAGGSFAMQASFPVKGDVTQIGSVAVTLTNSAGQTTSKLSFQ